MQNPSYDPQEDSFLLEKYVRALAFGKVLDIGTGSGIQALAAAESKKVSSVVAVDIQKGTIQYCKKNIPNPKIKFFVSDLFSLFQKGKGKNPKKFDTIIFNAPYLPTDPKTPDIALDGGKHGFEIIERFLREANDYLSDEGIILLLFSSLTKKDKVDGFIKENLFEGELLEKKGEFFEELYAYRMTKTPLLKGINRAGIFALHYFTKGKRGLVYKGHHKGIDVAVKIVNPKTTAVGKIAHEARMLRKLNEKGIGPRLILECPQFLVMEFINGAFVDDFIERSKKKNILSMMKSVLKQMKTLDDLGITKEEMQRPHKHIIVGKRPVLVDFERAHFVLRPSNVTQFCQYLTSSYLTPILSRKNINIDKSTLIEHARRYKNAKDKQERSKAFSSIGKEIVSS